MAHFLKKKVFPLDLRTLIPTLPTGLEYPLRLDQLIRSSLLCVQMYIHALVLK